MATRYYRKELPDQPLRLSNGVPLKGELFEVNDPWLISELDMAITRRVGGIIPLEKPEYDVLLAQKKSETPKTPEPREFGLNSLPQRPKSPAALVATRQEAPPTPPPPLEVPVFKPRTAKIPKAKE
jgi:hypothetical protein